MQGLTGFGRPSYSLDALKELDQQIQDTPNAQRYKLRANKFREIGLHKEAVDDLNKALQMAPGDSAAYLLRGENYLDEGMYPEALSDLNNAIKLDPQLLEAYAARASTHNKMKEFEKGLADANSALQIKSNSALGFLLRGTAYDGLKNYDKAISDCSAAINLNSSMPKAFYYRGFAYQNQGNYQKAVDDYTKALALQGGFRPALLGRAWSNFKLGQMDQAVADCGRAVRFDPEMLEEYNKFRGEKSTDASIVPDPEFLNGAQINDDLKNAITLYDDVLKKNPKDEEALRNRGLANMHLGKFEDGLKDFEAANAIAGISSDAADFPGFGKQSDYDAAKVVYEQGNKLLAAGNYADASAQYQAAIKQYPHYAKAWHNLGIATGYLNQFLGAELCCIKAISYRPDDWKLWDTLGFELFNEYQHDKSDPTKLDSARAALKRSLAMHPPDDGNKQDVKKLLARVDSYERSLCPANYVVVTTMPIN